MSTENADGTVTPITKADTAAGRARKGGTAKPAKATTKATKAPAKKATSKASTKATKASTNGSTKAPSTVSKEGTMKDSFTGEVLPVTAFPTFKDKDGNTVRRTVARKNVAAFKEFKASQKAKAKASA